MNTFSTLIKPASSLCNMRCRYCFYCDVAENRDVPSYGMMERATTEKLIDRIFGAVTPPAAVHFAFQGGEPTLAGIDYFTHFIAYANEKNQGRFSLHYSIQTNGLVVDEQWCRLFKENDFLVGVSLDGEESLHNFCRVDAQRQGTYARVRQAVRLLERAGVAYNILSVITKQMAKHPQALYRYYEKNKLGFVQLIPCLKPLEEQEDGPFDLTPRLYADFLKRFFTLWEQGIRRGAYISVRQFDNLVRMLQGKPAEQCGMMGFCTPQFVVEADGGVYPCDFYVLDRYLCGNVWEQPVEAMLQSEGVRRFLEDKVPEHPLCGACPVRSLCGGGCKRYRSFYAQEAGYCPYQDFLCYAYERLAALARTLR